MRSSTRLSDVAVPPFHKIGARVSFLITPSCSGEHNLDSSLPAPRTCIALVNRRMATMVDGWMDGDGDLQAAGATSASPCASAFAGWRG